MDIPLSQQNISQIYKDIGRHREHVKLIRRSMAFTKPATFPEIFGYDIILLEEGGVKVTITDSSKIEKGKFIFEKEEDINVICNHCRWKGYENELENNYQQCPDCGDTNIDIYEGVVYPVYLMNGEIFVIADRKDRAIQFAKEKYPEILDEDLDDVIGEIELNYIGI